MFSFWADSVEIKFGLAQAVELNIFECKNE